MRDNVTIKVYEHGELVEVRTGHNVWVDKGREYLASMVGYSSHDPDVPEATARVRYLGVGIGSAAQALQGMVTSPPISSSYPVPVAPNSTTGFDFVKEYPLNPEITTLERPVQISSGVWLVDDPNLFFTHITPYELTVHAIVDGTAGDVVFGGLTQMPLSEAALFLNSASKSAELNEVVAYYSFGTIQFSSNVRLEFIWSVGF